MPALPPGLKNVGAYVREIAVFSVGFFGALSVRNGWEVTQSTPESIFWDYVVFGGVALALGAVPWPRTRRMSQVAAGSFLANWVLFAWYIFAVTALLSPSRVETWPGLALEFFDLQVIATSLGAAALSMAGYALSRRFVTRRAVRAPAGNAAERDS